MKKILFFMFAALVFMFTALAFVACEKNDDWGEELGDLLYDDSGFVKLSEDSVTFDREKGGTITIKTEEAAYVDCMGTHVFIEGVGSNSNKDVIAFYKITPPSYILKYEDIKKVSVYEGFGCKVVRDGYRKFTITVKPNCGSDYDYDFNMIRIGITKIVNSKEYGPIAGNGGSYFTIYLK